MNTINSTDLSKKLGKVITVTSSRGGSGATALSILLGSALSQFIIKDETKNEERIVKTIVVDLDAKDGHVGLLTGYVKPTILQYKVQLDQDSSSAEVNSSIINRGNGKPDLLLAPRRSRTANDLNSEFYVDVVEKLQENYDFIVLNPATSNYNVLNTEVAHKLSDEVFYVLDTSLVSLFSYHKWSDENVLPSSFNGDASLDKKDVNIILNNSRSNSISPNVEKLMKDLNILTHVGYSERFNNMTDLQSIEEALKDEKLVEELTPVVDTILAL